MLAFLSFYSVVDVFKKYLKPNRYFDSFMQKTPNKMGSKHQNHQILSHFYQGELCSRIKSQDRND